MAVSPATSSRAASTAAPASLFVPAPGGGTTGNWWPGDLSWPNSTGAQNNVRYAYFAQARRLAIELNGTVTVYDTLDHQIGGFSQQQSHSGSLSFSSQYGLVDVASLPVISVNGAPPPLPALTPAPSAFQPGQSAPPFDPASSDTKADIVATIEQLAGLRAKGILSDEEFDAKKVQLLSRL
jgi:Short C-terminal domain